MVTSRRTVQYMYTLSPLVLREAWIWLYLIADCLLGMLGLGHWNKLGSDMEWVAIMECGVFFHLASLWRCCPTGDKPRDGASLKRLGRHVILVRGKSKYMNELLLRR